MALKSTPLPRLRLDLPQLLGEVDCSAALVFAQKLNRPRLRDPPCFYWGLGFRVYPLPPPPYPDFPRWPAAGFVLRTTLNGLRPASSFGRP